MKIRTLAVLFAAVLAFTMPAAAGSDCCAPDAACCGGPCC